MSDMAWDAARDSIEPEFPDPAPEPTEAEKNATLAQNVRDADVVILLYENGRAGSAFFKHVRGRIPYEVTVNYGEKDDPPQTIRRVTVKAGWTRADWRKMDRAGLHEPAPTDVQTEGSDG